MKNIQSDVKSVQDLLSKNRYTLQLYQREYSWEKKHVSELVLDLTKSFQKSYKKGHARKEVSNYDDYFLGSVIIGINKIHNYEVCSIVDGQQRLTTLTLFLIYLNNLQSESNKVKIDDLIKQDKHGEQSFVLDVEDRIDCMEALFNGGKYDPPGNDISIKNICARYSDFEDIFELHDKAALPNFIDWLIDKVYFVKITATSDDDDAFDDAFTIFETMNDRGLSLTHTEMLKGYLLSKIKKSERRTEANEVWKKHIGNLINFKKGTDAECIKAWLRSQYAKSEKDFDDIGSGFHRWVRINRSRLNLIDSDKFDESDKFADFIIKEFSFFAEIFLKILQACERRTSDLECIFYNAQHNFTLQLPLLLAPLNSNNKPATVHKRLQIVARYVDIIKNRGNWNSRNTGYGTMKPHILRTMNEIRGANNIRTLIKDLKRSIENEAIEGFTNFTGSYRLHGRNNQHTRLILARMIQYVHTKCKEKSYYQDYSNPNKYEIEHIWANRFQRYKDEFKEKDEFDEYRNRIGGLLLLPTNINIKLGDKPYEGEGNKLEIYWEQDILAKSLHEDHYKGKGSSKFIKFCEENEFNFRPYKEFKKKQLDERGELYRSLARQIWSPDRLNDIR